MTPTPYVDESTLRRLGGETFPERMFRVHSCPLPLGHTNTYTEHGKRMRASSVDEIRRKLNQRGVPLFSQGQLQSGFRLFTEDVTGFFYYADGRYWTIDPDQDIPNAAKKGGS